MNYFDREKTDKTLIKEPLLNGQRQEKDINDQDEIFFKDQYKIATSLPLQAELPKDCNLSSYLKTISFEGDLSEFYQVKQVFQRSEYCHTIGIILEITAPEIQKIITESIQTQHYKNRAVVFTHLFQIWTIKDGQGEKVYQMGLTNKQCINDCSIHENYAAFVLSKAENPQHHYLGKDKTNQQENGEDSSNRHFNEQKSVIHIISLDSKEEQSFDNMMEGPITALFVDEINLVIGSKNQIHYIQLKQVFSDGLMSPQNKQYDVKIPDSNVNIYAFWRGKFEKHYEVYTTNVNSSGIKVYNFEPVNMQTSNNLTNRFRKTKSIAHSIQSLDSALTNNSGLSLIKKIDTSTNKESLIQRPDRKIRVETQQQISNLNMIYSPTYKKTHSFLIKDPSHHKDETFTSKIVPEIVIQEYDTTMDHNFKLSLQPSDADRQHAMSSGGGEEENHSESEYFDNINVPEKKLSKSKFKRQSLKNIVSTSIDGNDNDIYVKTKFYWRQTLAFRQGGQIDFISSDGSVYSTQNLDLASEKYLQLDENFDFKAKSKIKILDAFVKGQDIYIFDENQTVHCLNIDTLTCHKTNLTPHEANILPYQDCLKIFQNFVLYDNQIIVSHGPILSVCNLNASVEGQESIWRHLYTQTKNEDGQSFHQNLLSMINEKKKSNQINPFTQCRSDIRFIKIREQENEVEPRLVILYNNNKIAVGIRNNKLQWEFEESQEWNITGEIEEIITSSQSTSLILFLHKDDQNQKQNQLLLYYCTDQSNINKMKILSDIELDERVFPINISELYMKDLTQNKPKIGIYNDSQRSIRIMQLEEDEDQNGQQYYGTMKQIHKIEKIKLHHTDLLKESGNDRYIFIARENKIFKLYLHEQILTEQLEQFAEVQSEQNKNGVKHEIQSFEIFDNGQFIYASTQTQMFFNHQGQFYSQGSVLSRSITKTNYNIYCDQKYNRFCSFVGPTTLQIFPFLHLNRISLMGIHHEAQPIFYQHKKEEVYVLTGDSKIKTWSTLTGKLLQSLQLQTQRYENYKRMNEREGKTLIYKQDTQDFLYHYLLLEIVSSSQIIEHATVLSEHKCSFFINSHKNLLFRKDVTQKKRNCFEICSFNHMIGKIIDRVKTVDQYCPINFLSPSFALYIDIDSTHSHIVIKETFTEKIVYTLPKNLRKSISTNHHNLTIEDIEEQIFFIDENLLLIENLQNFEVIYCIRNEKELLLFNKMKNNYRFNGYFMPDTTEKIFSTHKSIKNLFSGQIQPNDFIESDISVNEEGENQWWDTQLKDLMFLNMKRYREDKFMDNRTSGMLVWGLSEVGGGNAENNFEEQQAIHLKLYTMMPFSYLIWKMIDEVSSKRGLNIKDVDQGLLMLMSFAILPHKNETFMHKLVKHNTGDLMYLLNSSKSQNMVQLDQPLPHLKDHNGKTPLHLALDLNIRRQVDVLMTHLKDYPLDYCSSEIADLLPTLIKNNFINRVGDYLDARVLVPEWTSHYKREQLIIKAETNGKNYASTTYWPSTAQNFEKQFFSTQANDIPVKLELLDIPNIHLYGDTISEEFLNSIVRSGDIEIFDRKPVKAIISYKWEEARRVMMWKLFLPYMIYLAFFNFFLDYIFDREQGLELFGNPEKLILAERISKCILIMFATYFLIHEVKQIVRAAKGSSIYSAITDGEIIWSFVDGIPLLCNIVSMILDTFVGNDATSTRIQRPFYALSTLLLWLKVFYFLRLFRNLGHLVRMVFFVIYSIRHYMIICFCFTLAISNCFYVLSQNNSPQDRFIENYLDSLKFTFYLFMFRFDPERLGDVDLILVWAVLILSLTLQGFILFNLNVSMMKTYYDQCYRMSEQNTYRVQAMMIIESYDLVSVSSNVHMLFRDSYISNSLNGQQVGVNAMLSKYGSHKQYLLIAQPESEEFRPKLDENIQKLDELKQMIQKTSGAINKREDDIMQRIDQDIFNKMAEMEEKQNHMFSVLERRQLHMMKMIEQLVAEKTQRQQQQTNN